MLSSDNKRIAQNAGMLYVRMLFLLLQRFTHQESS